jgi:hypothetical protein
MSLDNLLSDARAVIARNHGFRTEDEFARAADLLSQVARILDQIAEKDRPVWSKFEARLCAAGAAHIEDIAAECDLVSLLVAQDRSFPHAPH